MSDSNSFIPSQSGGQPYSVRELVDVLGQATNQITTLHKYTASDFKIQTIKVRFYQEHVHAIAFILFQLGLPEDKTKVNISAETEVVLDMIHTIATQIQFHDIIHQKLEHMIQINQEILEELSHFNQTDSTTHQADSGSFLPVVPGMMQYGVAQLSQITEEYEQTFASIKIQLDGIKEYAASISYISTNQLQKLKQEPAMDIVHKHHFAYLLRLSDQLQVEATASLMQINNNAAFEQLLIEIISQLSTIGQKAPVLKQPIGYTTLAATLKHIAKVYTMESERTIYYQVFNTAYSTEEATSTDVELF